MYSDVVEIPMTSPNHARGLDPTPSGFSFNLRKATMLTMMAMIPINGSSENSPRYPATIAEAGLPAGVSNRSTPAGTSRRRTAIEGRGTRRNSDTSALPPGSARRRTRQLFISSRTAGGWLGLREVSLPAVISG